MAGGPVRPPTPPLDEAGRQLVERNLALAYYYAKAFVHDYPSIGDELIGAAHLGLVLDACRHKPDYQPFHAYAKQMILWTVRDQLWAWFRPLGYRRKCGGQGEPPQTCNIDGEVEPLAPPRPDDED